MANTLFIVTEIFVPTLRGPFFYSVNSSCSRACIPSNCLAALPSTPYLDPENGKLLWETYSKFHNDRRMALFFVCAIV